MDSFEKLKLDFDSRNSAIVQYDCILPVHLTKGKKETNLRKKDGSFNEQFFKWEFLESFVYSGLCSKDYIGVEVQFPKGNKGASMIKMDAAVFDDKDWFTYWGYAKQGLPVVTMGV